MVIYLGYLIVALIMIADIPQLIKTQKYKNIKGLSFGTLNLRWLMYLCWTIYGIILNDFVLMIVCSFCMVIISYIMLECIITNVHNDEHFYF